MQRSKNKTRTVGSSCYFRVLRSKINFLAMALLLHAVLLGLAGRRAGAPWRKHAALGMPLPSTLSNDDLATLAIGDNTATHLGHVVERRVRMDRHGSTTLSVYELSDAPDDTLDAYCSQLWPAATHLARYLVTVAPAAVRGLTVLELGCGNGLASLAAARAGAAAVRATDYRDLALHLVSRAASEQQLAQITTQVVDFASPLPDASVVHLTRVARARKIEPIASPLPPHDVLLAADIGYSPALAWRLGERCRRTVEEGGRVIVAESRQNPACRGAFSQAFNLHREPNAPTLRLQVSWPVSRLVHTSQ